ncbi:hypothetical protein V5O48_017205 [Marasmius crinis-equi]|uniref:Uncharacterized protein n=1 Tax=Marasmius crinis-equi TaxID=585013 RepID=A0ABR3EPM2_9AGAR
MIAAGYFPVLAPLDVTQNAYALAFHSFGRTFAGVWGISISNTVFQNELHKRLRPGLVEALGGALSADRLYGFVPKIRFLDEPAKGELQQAFGDGIGVLWAALTGIAGLGFLISFLMKDIPLQNVRDEKWTNEELRDVESGHPASAEEADSEERCVLPMAMKEGGWNRL